MYVLRNNAPGWHHSVVELTPSMLVEVCSVSLFLPGCLLPPLSTMSAVRSLLAAALELDANAAPLHLLGTPSETVSRYVLVFFVSALCPHFSSSGAIAAMRRAREENNVTCKAVAKLCHVLNNRANKRVKQYTLPFHVSMVSAFARGSETTAWARPDRNATTLC